MDYHPSSSRYFYIEPKANQSHPTQLAFYLQIYEHLLYTNIYYFVQEKT